MFVRLPLFFTIARVSSAIRRRGELRPGGGSRATP